MPSIDPFNRYNPIPLSRKRRGRGPSARSIVIFILLFMGLLTFKAKLMNQYNYLVGLKHWRKGNLELAKMEFTKLLNRVPGDALAVDGLGLVEMKAGNLDKAREQYAQAMKLGLNYSRRFSHLETGKTFIDAGKYPQALLELQHALELRPNDPEGLIALGTAERALGLVAQGEKHYETALTKDPKNVKMQRLLEQAREEKDRGSIYYIFDRNGSPLALQWTKNGEKGYPMGKEFAHLIGYSDLHETNNRGITGLEKVFKEQFPGNKLYLTIDSRIQKVISKAMGWQKGSIIVLNPRTGEILGCISQPTYTPEKVHDDWWNYISNRNKPLQNRAFEALYEPGSIIKIITSAAALEKNLNLNTVFPFFCKGFQYYDSQMFMDWQRHKNIRSLEEAFDTSCNIAYAKLGAALGEDVVLEFNNLFGMNSSLKTLPIPVVSGSTPKMGLTRFELAEASTGLGKNFRITPLNAVMIASIIANDGVLMSPYLTSKLTNINGRVLEETQPLVFKNAVSRQTAQIMAKMMFNDVERGIGVKARVAGVRVAGKTGTSGSRNPNFHAWFICFAPVENPRIAMVVLAEEGGTGKDIAAPIARKCIEGINEIMDLTSSGQKN